MEDNDTIHVESKLKRNSSLDGSELNLFGRTLEV